MPRYSYDRLTALDNSFLLLEKPHADYELVPDLDQFVQAIRSSFQALREAAGVVSAVPKRRKPARTGKASRANGGSAPS